MLDPLSYKTEFGDYQKHNRELEETKKIGQNVYVSHYSSFFVCKLIIMTPEYEIILVQTAEQRQECYDVVNFIILL